MKRFTCLAFCSRRGPSVPRAVDLPAVEDRRCRGHLLREDLQGSIPLAGGPQGQGRGSLVQGAGGADRRPPGEDSGRGRPRQRVDGAGQAETRQVHGHRLRERTGLLQEDARGRERGQALLPPGMERGGEAALRSGDLQGGRDDDDRERAALFRRPLRRPGFLREGSRILRDPDPGRRPGNAASREHLPLLRPVQLVAGQQVPLLRRREGRRHQEPRDRVEPEDQAAQGRARASTRTSTSSATNATPSWGSRPRNFPRPSSTRSPRTTSSGRSTPCSRKCGCSTHPSQS